MEAMIQIGHDALPTTVPANPALFCLAGELVHCLAGSGYHDRKAMGVLFGIV